MQMHLDKCKEYRVVSRQSPGLDGSSSASIPVPSFSSLPSSTPGVQFLIDSVDQRSRVYADECLARAVYATSSPLALADNIYWRRFFSVLRTASCPPTGEALSSHLLDCEHDRVQSQVHEAIGKADGVAIMCSGWSDIKEAGSVIYAVATPAPLFYKCTKTKEQTHTGGVIAEQPKEIINEVGPQKVFGVVTDDTPEMVAARAEVEEAFPHISAVGCTACGIRQLFDDVVAQPSVRALCGRAEQVARYVRERKVLADTFRRWQTTKLRNHTAHGTMSAPPVSSDWTGVVNMFSSLLLGQTCLQDMAVSPTLEVEASFRATVQDEVRCQEISVKPIHVAAYMLDPKHAGQRTLSGEQINSAYYVISNLSRHLSLDEGKVLGSFARFSAKQGLWKGAGIWSSCQHVSASTWWKGLCSSEPLSAVASAILQIPPTTGACERLRSRFCNSKTRGALSADRVQKLVAVQANLNLLEPSDCEYAPQESEDEKRVLFQSETQ